MSNRHEIPRHKTCVHLARFGFCLEPTCEFADKREPVERAFGSNPSSAYASQLHRENVAEYERLRVEAVKRGLIAPRLSDRVRRIDVDVPEF